LRFVFDSEGEELAVVHLGERPQLKLHVVGGDVTADVFHILGDIRHRSERCSNLALGLALIEDKEIHPGVAVGAGVADAAEALAVLFWIEKGGFGPFRPAAERVAFARGVGPDLLGGRQMARAAEVDYAVLDDPVAIVAVLVGAVPPGGAVLMAGALVVAEEIVE